MKSPSAACHFETGLKLQRSHLQQTLAIKIITHTSQATQNKLSAKIELWAVQMAKKLISRQPTTSIYERYQIKTAEKQAMMTYRPTIKLSRLFPSITTSRLLLSKSMFSPQTKCFRTQTRSKFQIAPWIPSTREFKICAKLLLNQLPQYLLKIRLKRTGPNNQLKAETSLWAVCHHRHSLNFQILSQSKICNKRGIPLWEPNLGPNQGKGPRSIISGVCNKSTTLL